MPIRSQQSEGKRGAKVDGICDLTYKTNSESRAIPEVTKKRHDCAIENNKYKKMT